MLSKKKQERKRRKGIFSAPFTVLILICATFIMGIFATFQNVRTIRQLEAAADLAAVEALRANVDETELRQENLVIKDPAKVRKLFLDKVRITVQKNLKNVERIEIPMISGSTTEFASDSSNWTEHYNAVTNTVRYDCGTFSMVEDTSNLMTSGTHSTWSYFLDSELVIFFRTLPYTNSLTKYLVYYTDIFDDRNLTIETVQDEDKSGLVLTIQTIGKVTLK